MYHEVNTTAIDIKKHKGESYAGTFKGSHEITTKIGKQVIWEFADEAGLSFGVYGFTNLNRALETIPTDSQVRMTYLGTENVKTKYGQKDVHMVKVEVDDGAEEPEPGKGKDLPF
jgi:hypothetical protein